MPFSEQFSSVQEVLGSTEGGPSKRFDGDHPLSAWLAHVSGDDEMTLEIETRQGFITAARELASAADRQGYRHAAALLLDLTANLGRALVLDELPAHHGEAGSFPCHITVVESYPNAR